MRLPVQLAADVQQLWKVLVCLKASNKDIKNIFRSLVSFELVAHLNGFDVCSGLLYKHTVPNFFPCVPPEVQTIPNQRKCCMMACVASSSSKAGASAAVAYDPWLFLDDCMILHWSAGYLHGSECWWWWWWKYQWLHCCECRWKQTLMLWPAGSWCCLVYYQKSHRHHL